ncbi:MAG: SDR family oxidoreductase [Cephaloticoccus sp.]|nr:SDR family oxidoreductase [Cephaloticoccus sp.]MCF7760686.1 SDR family oxidoreductase [Cephaloticoccus sp.]
MKIVITGVTRGLGLALAEAYIKAGHSVIGCGRNGPEIFDLRMSYPEHSFTVVDVALDNKVALWAVDVLGTHDAPDLLINNAAIMNRLAPVWEQGDGEFTKLVDVNLRGVMNVIRHFVPPMVEAKKGVIVNISSGWGRSVSPEVGPYCMSKWGIEGLTKAMAEELPEGMAAVPLNPGVIDTDMLRSCWAEGAAGHPKAEKWAEIAAPYILQLGTKDNGRSVTVPAA